MSWIEKAFWIVVFGVAFPFIWIYHKLWMSIYMRRKYGRKNKGDVKMENGRYIPKKGDKFVAIQMTTSKKARYSPCICTKVKTDHLGAKDKINADRIFYFGDWWFRKLTGCRLGCPARS